MIHLTAGQSINLTTGVVTSPSQFAPATSQATLQSRTANGLRRNDLRALHEMIMETAPAGDCAWTREACHRSQVAHGRFDDCVIHPAWH